MVVVVAVAALELQNKGKIKKRKTLRNHEEQIGLLLTLADVSLLPIRTV